MIFNGEVWYDVTRKEIEDLESVDRMFLNQLMGIPKTAPMEAVYLELGIMPIRMIIKQRRLKYLYYLLKRKSNQMISHFFLAQSNNPSPGDWTETVKKDMEDVGIDLEKEDIKNMSKHSYEKLVKEKSNYMLSHR